MNSKCVSIWCAIVYAAGCVQAQSNTCSVSSGSSTLTSALLKSLIAGADQSVRPSADCGGPTVISGSASLLSFYKDTVNSRIYRLNANINLNWNDPRLAWDPAQFGGAQTIQIPTDKIWVPDIVISNIYNYKDGVLGKTVYNAVVTSNGHVALSQPSTSQSAGVTTKDSAGLDVVTIQGSLASLSYDKTGIIIQPDSNPFALGNFYDQNGVEDYVFINGTLSVTEKIYPISSNPFSVVVLAMNLQSKAKVTCAAACY